MTPPAATAGPALRATSGVVGALILAAGVWFAIVFARALIGVIGSQLVPPPYTTREALFLAVWLVFSLSMAAAGVSLLVSSWRRRRFDLVPGPTLYVAGCSLVVIGLFFLEARGFVAGVVAVLAGAALMVVEYRSATL